ncbi:mitogen-activated protein kinase-binding protein 1-like, partial [Scleropages formosus]
RDGRPWGSTPLDATRRCPNRNDMTVDGSTIKSRIRNLLRSPSIKLRRSRGGAHKESLLHKVTLEKVLGITASGNHALACDPRSGLVAYPAG